MKTQHITVRQFLKVYTGDIDVYDNYCEELGIAYCGDSVALTDKGEKHFAEALELPVIEIHDNAIIGVDMLGLTEKEIEKRLKQAKELFHSLAGECSEKDYDLWFKEIE